MKTTTADQPWGSIFDIFKSNKTANVSESAVADLLACPLCGGTEFEMHRESKNVCAAIFCKKCPYGCDGGDHTLDEIIKTHNTRAS